MTVRERFEAWARTEYSRSLSDAPFTWDDKGPIARDRQGRVVVNLVQPYRAFDAAFRAARDEAVAAAEESISKRIAYLKESSDEEKKEYGYLRAKKEKWIDGRPCRGFRDGWTLFGFARNEMCIVYQELPAAIRSRLDAASRDGGV